MECAERMRLLLAWQSARAEYTHTHWGIVAGVIDSLTFDVEAHLQEATEAKDRMLAARSAVAKHERTHQCAQTLA